jgi:hypothetical protein
MIGVSVLMLSAAHRHDTCPDFHRDPDTGGAHHVLQDNAWIDKTMHKFRNHSEFTKKTLRAKFVKWRHNAANGIDSVEGYGGLTRTTTAFERHLGKIRASKRPFNGKSRPGEPGLTLTCIFYQKITISLLSMPPLHAKPHIVLK